MPIVYNLHVYDIYTDLSSMSLGKRTLQCIQHMNEQPVLETAEEVDEADIDEYGRYVPKDKTVINYDK